MSTRDKPDIGEWAAIGEPDSQPTRDGWAAAAPTYQWKEGDTAETAPVDQKLEGELFGENSRANAGLNFSKYRTIKVAIKNVPRDFKALTSFDQAGLTPSVIRNVQLMKFDQPTPIQANAIPLIMAGCDMMACAQTGSGKTAAFLTPIISTLIRKLESGKVRLSVGRCVRPLALILAPTRELATQIFDDARRFTNRSQLRPRVIYGGPDTQILRAQLAQGCEVLVATPGRLKDFIEKQIVSLSSLRFLVLDEADRMLDMGFEKDIRAIVQNSDMPQEDEVTTLMFSATFPSEIQRLARDFLKPEFVKVRIGRVGGTTSDITQTVKLVHKWDKFQQVLDLILSQPPARILIFTHTKRGADTLDDFLFNKGLPCTSIHGDRNQREREDALEAFKIGAKPILIATSVASRGLDVRDVMHVINFDMPTDIDEYVHRIGRTARVGNPGLATSFFTEGDMNLAPLVKKLLIECQQVIPEFLADIDAGESVSYDDDWDNDNFDEDQETGYGTSNASNAGGGGGWGTESSSGGGGWRTDNAAAGASGSSSGGRDTKVSGW